MDNKIDTFDLNSDECILEHKTYTKDNKLADIYAGSNVTDTTPNLFSYQYVTPDEPPIISGDIGDYQDDLYNGLVQNSEPVEQGSIDPDVDCPEDFKRMINQIKSDLNGISNGSYHDTITSGATKKSSNPNKTDIDLMANTNLEQQHFSSDLQSTLNGRAVTNAKLSNMGKDIATYIIKTYGKNEEMKPDMFFKALTVFKIKNLLTPEMQELYTVTSSYYNRMISNTFSSDINPLFAMDYSLLSQVDRAKLNMMEDVIINSGYLEFIEYSKIQGNSYQGVPTIMKKKLNPSKLMNIHPLFACFFLEKLPLVEESCIRGDSYMFMRQKLHRSNMLRSDNYDLFLNRMSDTAPMHVVGSEGILDTELRHIHMHSLLRRIVVGMRNGNFESTYSDQLIGWLKRCLPNNYKSIITEDELIISSFLYLFGIKPTMIIYPRVHNNIITSDIKVTPMVYYVPRNSRFPVSNININGVSRNPFKINSEMVSSLMYNPSTQKIVYENVANNANISASTNMMKGVSAMDPNMIAQLRSGNMFGLHNRVLLTNGVLIYYIQRRVSTIDSKLGSDKFSSFKSYIRNNIVDFENNLRINDTNYQLRSVLCHRAAKTNSEYQLAYDLVETEGFTAYIRNLNSEPVTTTTKDSENIFSPANPLDNVDNPSEIPRDEELTEATFYKYDPYKTLETENTPTFKDFFSYDPVEANDEMRKYCCMLVYSIDYKEYLKGRDYAQLAYV